MNDILIRPATEADFDAMWDIFHTHVAAGETYPFAPDTSKEACHDYWFGPRVVTNVAVTSRERLLGMYRLVPNQVGLGSHVANASYMVSPAAQGIGVGLMLGQHSLDAARGLGYLAMQFNLVVSTNLGAIVLWKKIGFSIVGTLPKAFRHARLGFVDAHVMYRLLDDPAVWPPAAD